MLYRHVRSLMRLNNIPYEAGDCNESAIELAQHIPGAIVIFGVLIYNNRRMDHAWIQLPDGTNIDPTCGVTMTELGIRTAPAIYIWNNEKSNIYSTQMITCETSGGDEGTSGAQLCEPNRAGELTRVVH